MSSTAVADLWYTDNAHEVCPRYDGLDPLVLNSWFVDDLPDHAARILDVGSGSGRDAAWMAGLGHRVTAVEPNDAMRTSATRTYANAYVEWMSDSLPALPAMCSRGERYDFILLSAVWMHLEPRLRPAAMNTLAALLKPEGSIAITLRMGPTEPDRGIHPVDLEELDMLATAAGLEIRRSEDLSDELGRSVVTWTNVILRRRKRS
jgi:SAM-dependent methyltransferase